MEHFVSSANLSTLLARGKHENAFAIHRVHLGAMLTHEGQVAYGGVFRVQAGSDVYATAFGVYYPVSETTKEALAPHWFISCADEYLHTPEAAAERVQLALKHEQNKNCSASLIQSAPGGNVVSGLQTNCSFSIKAASGRLCLHTSHTLAHILQTQVELGVEDWPAKLEDILQGSGSAPEEEGSEEITTAVKLLLDSYRAGRAVLLVGPKGTGKTYAAGEFAKLQDAVYIEVPCAPDTEKWNLFKHTVPEGGNYFQVDGPISEAAKRAACGEKVVLVLDEFLNLNPVYQTMLNSMLSRREGDTYHVYTGGLIHNPDGSTSYETIVVPIENLFVVATGNLGDKYGVDSINPSVRRRFRVKWLHASVDASMEIVRIALRKNDMPEELANPIQDLMDKIQKSCGQKLLEEDLCTGVVCEVIRAAKATAVAQKRVPKAAKGWVAFLKQQLIEEAYQLVSLEEGAENNQEGQLKTFTSIIEEMKWKI